MSRKVGIPGLVERFAAEMLRKLKKKQRGGWSGWNALYNKEDFERRLMLHALRGVHGETGQWVDVANFAAFLDNIERQRATEDKKRITKKRRTKKSGRTRSKI